MDHIIHSNREESNRRTTVNHKRVQCLPIITDRYVKRLGFYSGVVLSSQGGKH